MSADERHMRELDQRPPLVRTLGYLRLMEEELADKPDGRLYATAAAVYMYQLEEFGKAREYYQAAADHGYHPQKSLEGVAEAHYRLGELHAAYELYLRLYGEEHVTFSLCTNLANLMVRSDQPQRAIQLLQQALELVASGQTTMPEALHLAVGEEKAAADEATEAGAMPDPTHIAAGAG